MCNAVEKQRSFWGLPMFLIVGRVVANFSWDITNYREETAELSKGTKDAATTSVTHMR